MLGFARSNAIFASDFCLWKSVFFRQKSVLHRLSGSKSSFFQRHKLQKKEVGVFPSNLNFLLDYKAISPYGDRNANGAGSRYAVALRQPMPLILYTPLLPS